MSTKRWERRTSISGRFYHIVGRFEEVVEAAARNPTLFNEQQATRFDGNIESEAGVPDPDFLRPTEYQSPRSWRFAVLCSF